MMRHLSGAVQVLVRLVLAPETFRVTSPSHCSELVTSWLCGVEKAKCMWMTTWWACLVTPRV